MKRFKKAEDVKVGVIGYGGAFNMGRAHLNEMKKAGMTPVAVAELDADRRKVAGQEFPGIQTYATVPEMLKKSDVSLVCIITPHNTHARIALECLKAGRHVVCEKPLAIFTKECDAMIAEARKRGLMLSTYHNRHWDGCILQALKTVRSGAIGDVFRIEAHMGGYHAAREWWRDSKSISGGILYDWGVHLLEYSLQILGSDILEVSAHSKTGFWSKTSPWKEDTNEDEGFAVIRFKSGSWLTLCITRLDANPKRMVLEITGTRGAHLFDHRTYETISMDGDKTVTTKGANPPNEGWRFYQNIADHFVQGEKLVITPEWARRPIHILDLAGQSAKKGVALKPKYK